MTDQTRAPHFTVIGVRPEEQSVAADGIESFVLVELSSRRKLEVAAKPVDPLGPQLRLEMLLHGHPTGWRLFLKPRSARALASALVAMTDRLDQSVPTSTPATPASITPPSQEITR